MVAQPAGMLFTPNSAPGRGSRGTIRVTRNSALLLLLLLLLNQQQRRQQVEVTKRGKTSQADEGAGVAQPAMSVGSRRLRGVANLARIRLSEVSNGSLSLSPSRSSVGWMAPR